MSALHLKKGSTGHSAYNWNSTLSDVKETHTPAILVDSESGVLARVIGLFSGRGDNIRIDDTADLDGAIKEMLAYYGPVIFDCRVEKHENCFPMIPSGKAHNDMLLGDAETAGVIDAKGSVLV